MKFTLTFVFFVLISLVCVSASAQTADPPKATVPETATAVEKSDAVKPVKDATTVSQGKRVIQSVSEQLADKSIAKNALLVIDELLDDTRSAQSRIYNAVRTINRNLDLLESSSPDTVTRARELTRKLLASSYNDSLLQSGNLSDHLVTRLSNLVADSVLMQKNASANLRADFISELGILSNRFLDSKRFRIGIGAEYLYLPKISYAAPLSIDLTAFQSPNFRSGSQTGILVDFSNQATPATRLTASGSGLDVTLSLPSQKQAREIVTGVRQAPVDPNSALPSLLYRTTLTSTVKTEFDASLAVSVLYAYDALFRKPEDSRGRQRVAYHAGIGTTGFKIEEAAVTEVKRRTETTQSFNDLPTIGTTSSRRRVALNFPYWSVGASFIVSDESRMGLGYRRYIARNDLDETAPRATGTSFSIYFLWQPTFGW